MGSYSGTYSSLTISAANATITATGEVLNTTPGSIALDCAAGVTLLNVGRVEATETDGSIAIYMTSGAITNTGLVKGYEGIDFAETSTLANTGTIEAVRVGVDLNDGGVFANLAGGAIEISGSYGVGALFYGSITARNSGIIAVSVNQNPGTASIEATGVNLYNATQFFSNTGVIKVTHKAAYYGHFTGISTFGNDTVVNTGTIEAAYGSGNSNSVRRPSPDAVRIVQDQNYGVGVALNDSNLYNSGVIAAHNIGVLATGDSYIQNSGSIVALPAGVKLAGGLLVNTGFIGAFSNHYSAGVYLTSGTLINAGTIEASGTYDTYGIYARGSSYSITNKLHGVIAGIIGIDFYNDTGQTLTNAGTIRSTEGTAGIAVQFNAGDDLLLLRPGSAFVGTVNGGGGTNALELSNGTGIGALSGFGSSVIAFQSLTVDYGATWQLNGANDLASAVAITDYGVLRLGGTTAVAGTISGSGMLVFDGIDMLDDTASLDMLGLGIAGGTTTLAADLDYRGSFEQSGGTLALAGFDFDLNSPATLNGGAIAGSGTFDTEGSVLLASFALQNGATWQADGKIVETGNLVLGNAGAVGHAVLASSAIFDITGSGGIAIAAGGGGGFVNDGLLEKTGGTGSSNIAANLTDPGRIAITTGTLDLTGAHNTISGTVSGAGTLQFGGGATTVASGAAFSIAHVTLSGGVLTLAINLNYAGRFAETGGLLALGNGKILTLQGAAAFSGGTIKGTGTIASGDVDTMAAATVGGLTLSEGALLRVFGTTSLVGNLSLGGADGTYGLFSTRPTGILDIVANVGIMVVAGGHGSIHNLGIFEKTGGVGISLVVPAFENDNHVLVTIGTLGFGNAVTGTGSFSIGKKGVLEFKKGVAASQVVNFASTAGGTLLLDDPSGTGLGFAGTIHGFENSDKLDLATFAFSGKPTLKWSQSGGKGTLTVIDGKDTAKLVLFGQYAAAGFHLNKGAGGSTVVTYTPPKQVALATPHL